MTCSRAEPALRILLALASVFAIALLPQTLWVWQFLWLFPLVALTWKTGLPLRDLANRACVLLPFLALVALGLISQPNAGLRIANLTLKSVLSFWMLALLIQATPLPELTRGLRQLRLPRLWVDLIAFLHRYFHVLVDEWTRMQWARRARTFKIGPWQQFLALTRSLGMLFIRAYERAEHIHQAMLARGYQTDKKQ